MWGPSALLVSARADGCLILGQPLPLPLPLPHLHGRDESESNVIGYSGLAMAVIGAIIPALGVFKG